MQTTMNLLDEALEQKPVQEWHKSLKLNRNAFHNARMRGHLSPAIAGALAEELGKNPADWIVIAALESERDSACKERMVRRLGGGLHHFSDVTGERTHRPRPSCRWMWSRRHAAEMPSISARTSWVTYPARQTFAACLAS